MNAIGGAGVPAAGHAPGRDLGTQRPAGDHGRGDVPAEGPQGRGHGARHHARGDLHDARARAGAPTGAAAVLVPVPDQVPGRATAEERAAARARVHHEGLLQLRPRRGRAGQVVRRAPGRLRADLRPARASRPSPVEASNGTMGGSDSIEFMCPSEAGEDLVATCPNCDYAANLEKATSALAPIEDEPGPAAPARLDTPGVRTIEDLATSYGLAADRQIKTLVQVIDGQLTLVLLRGDHPLAGPEADRRHRARPTSARPSRRRSRLRSARCPAAWARSASPTCRSSPTSRCAAGATWPPAPTPTTST